MSNNNNSNGIGFGTVLLLVFIVLKLCHVIDWSWWWVMSPLWIGLCLVVILFAVAGFLYYLAWSRRSRS